MSLDINKLMHDARVLAERMRDKESATDCLITQTQNLHNRVLSMKQCQDDLESGDLILQQQREAVIREVAKDNHVIRELEVENRRLRLSLDDYKTALEMIMSKYREKVSQIISSRQLATVENKSDQSQEVNRLIDKVCEMASVMYKAAGINEDTEKMGVDSLIEKLQLENRGLRELLSISSTDIRHLDKDCEHKSCQTINLSLVSSESDSGSPNSSILLAPDSMSNIRSSNS